MEVDAPVVRGERGWIAVSAATFHERISRFRGVSCFLEDRALALFVVLLLEVNKNPRKGGDSNPRDHDDAVREVVESLRWCPERPIDANPNGGLFSKLLSTELPQLGGPVPVGFDVKLELLSDARRYGRNRQLPSCQWDPRNLLLISNIHFTSMLKDSQPINRSTIRISE